MCRPDPFSVAEAVPVRPGGYQGYLTSTRRSGLRLECLILEQDPEEEDVQAEEQAWVEQGLREGK